MAKSKDGRGFFRKSNFVEAVSKYYYVDKSLLIKDLIDNENGDDVFLFTRPRRFGKSLNLSMIRTFFEKTEDDMSVYFKDLEIWKCGEKYTSEQGKYPVICFDFKDVLDESWSKMYSSIKTIIADVFKRFKYIVPNLEKEDAEKFGGIRNRTAEDDDIAYSLKYLSEFLYEFYGVKPIILIDEYDVPIQKGYEKGYYDDVVDFMRIFLSSALKGNDLNMTFAVITGAMRVAKAGIYTGLNNLGVYSVLENKYSQYFGFTKAEVTKILNDFGHPEKEKEICDRYDGYRFGDEEIFNPWSVAHYVINDFKPKTYWLDSSGNSVIKDMLRVTTERIADCILKISQGKTVSVPINENITFADIKDDENNIFSILLATGYLKVVSGRGKKYRVVAPNKEVKEIYSEEILKYVWHESGSDADRIRCALIESDADELGELLSDSMCRVAGFFETAYENSYQILMLGVSFHLTDIYVVRSNAKAGYGLYDLEFSPKNQRKGLPGIIIETERRKTDEELGAAADHALKQIEEKRYDINLKERGVAKIDKYGIAFCGQKVVVKKA